MAERKSDKKKNIANVVKAIIKKSPAPGRRAKSPTVMSKAGDGEKAQTLLESGRPKQDVAALEELELSEIAVAEHVEPEKPKPPKQAAKKEPTTEEISARAYLIWEREGRPHGCSDRHWLQAVQELQSMKN